MTRRSRFLALPLVAAALLVGPQMADAHVEVEADDAVQGGYATLVLSLPNERSDASTVTVDLKLPEGTPIAFAVPQPLDGWEASVSTRQLDDPLQIGDLQVNDVADVVTWTATAGGLSGEERAEFAVLVGPFPLDVTEIGFPTVQTYNTGEAVRWIEPMAADGSEPELPLPMLEVGTGSGAFAPVPAEMSALVEAQQVPEVTTITEPAATEAPVTEPAATEAPTSEPEVTAEAPLVIAPAPEPTAGEASEPTPGEATDDGSSSGPIVAGVVILAAAAAGAVLLVRRRRISG